MKKIFALILAGLTLCSCGAKPDEPAVSADPAAAPIDAPAFDLPPKTKIADVSDIQNPTETEASEDVLDEPEPVEPQSWFEIGDEDDRDFADSDLIDFEIAEKYRETLVLRIKNLSDEPMDRGGAFIIEKNIDGKWHRLYSQSDIMFPATNFWVEPGEEAFDIISLEKFFGEMPDGNYRIVKDFNPESDYQNPIELAVEFDFDDDDLPNLPGQPDVMMLPDKIEEGLELTADADKAVLRNLTDRDAEYGENFRLARLIGGKWYYLRETEPDRPVPAILLTTPAGAESELDWVDVGVYGELPEGRYGIAIAVNLGGEEKVAFGEIAGDY